MIIPEIYDIPSLHRFLDAREDDDSATVNGIITSDGLFEGTVTTSSEEYHIEPVNRYVSPGMREPTFIP
ncbi:unnamed protein product [Acanthoscelides obtectus]|uniref:Uncharacterized protein n=1 Tax=Acanthoscelides obtectus TaxID=200917 RepID=A0A9P0PQ60_ACAOB|nr:unnamed protein product [Acanthoscelides obtectus]CAK1630967.1 hypothetical protein AOBTE_LOCUS6678 [Acanthoscelides obtectus]